jgi:hypothetical protein
VKHFLLITLTAISLINSLISLAIWILSRAYPMDHGEWTVAIPFALMAVISAVFPLSKGGAIMAWMRARKSSRAGLCPTCDYDLRATPDRCPEMFSLL